LDAVAERSREIIRQGSKSFAAAARLFDADTRADVYKLYAWCRYCDDLIDGQELGFGREQISQADSDARLALLRRETERVLIRAGLESGERVSVSPLAVAMEGMRVRPVAVGARLDMPQVAAGQAAPSEEQTP